MKRLVLSLTLGLGLVTVAITGGVAEAGRGSSPGAIKNAIESGSVDAIAGELERAERLVCGSCVEMVRPLVDHQDARVRKVAAWWLARRGVRGEIFVEMATRLGQPDSRKAEAAADVLGSLRHPMAPIPLGAALNNPRFDTEARVAMAGALGRIGDGAARGDLMQAAGDMGADGRVRAAALGALRELSVGQSGSNPALVNAATARLSDTDLEVRVQALYAIGATGGRGLDARALEDAARALTRVVREDPEARARKKAVWALGEIHAPAALAGEAISGAATGDGDAAVRSLAGAALGKLATAPAR